MEVRGTVAGVARFGVDCQTETGYRAFMRLPSRTMTETELRAWLQEAVATLGNQRAVAQVLAPDRPWQGVAARISDCLNGKPPQPSLLKALGMVRLYGPAQGGKA